MNTKIRSALQLAQKHERAGRLAEAASIYAQVAAHAPNNAEARKGVARLGAAKGGPDPVQQLRALYGQRQFKAVVQMVKTVLKTTRNKSMVHMLEGAAQIELGKPARAEAAFSAALKAAPDQPSGYNNLGLALRAQSKTAQARAAFEKALKLKPDYGDAWNSLGTVLQETGEVTQAQNAFEKAAHLKPNDPEIWTNLGNMHQHLGRSAEAISSYEKALGLAVDHAGANYNYGLTLKSLGRFQEAVGYYRKAIASRPNFAAAHNNLGTALLSMGQLLVAEDAFIQATQLAPNDADAFNNLGTVLQKIGRMDEAVAAFDKALKIVPDHAMAQAQRLHQLAQMCDWQAYRDMDRVGAALGIEGGEIPPLTLLAMEDAPARQLARAQHYAARSFAKAETPVPCTMPQRPQKLRVGYFSADYRNHPVARLIAGTLTDHDRDRFELFGYSFGPNTKDQFRLELSGQFAQFADIKEMSDAAAAELIAKDKLDIAVDLTCYTQHTRTGLFANRLAPVQINYLGYPGTSGADFMDYILVDPVLVPPDHSEFVSEALMVMPDCYQPNDNRRDVPKDTASRADHGLPDDAFVLCCFNSSYKISPREFNIWMRVLGEVPNAVLWLLASSDWAQNNLRREAVNAGIDPDRLVFAPRASNEAHLARHDHADLFLDTFAYNAHTTGSDALWMGLPVVTLEGQQFAARVCASLLSAVGLPELITRSEEDYEALIIRLARSKPTLDKMRKHLKDTRRMAPLFDTQNYTRALEAGLDAADAKWRAGQGPSDIKIARQSG